MAAGVRVTDERRGRRLTDPPGGLGEHRGVEVRGREGGDLYPHARSAIGCARWPMDEIRVTVKPYGGVCVMLE